MEKEFCSKSSILTFSGMFVDEMPACVANFRNLTTIYANGNCFREIPEPLFELKKLQILHLSRNNIIYVSSRIGVWKDLTDLFLSSNEIHYFPFRFLPEGQMKSLELHGNKLLLKWPSFFDNGEVDLEELIMAGKTIYNAFDTAVCIVAMRRFCASDLSALPKEVVSMIAIAVIQSEFPHVKVKFRV